jgi:hypothetical protein
VDTVDRLRARGWNSGRQVSFWGNPEQAALTSIESLREIRKLLQTAAVGPTLGYYERLFDGRWASCYGALSCSDSSSHQLGSLFGI